MTLPSGDDPHNSGPIQWARGGCRADAPPLAARPREPDLFPRGFGSKEEDAMIVSLGHSLRLLFFFFRLRFLPIPIEIPQSPFAWKYYMSMT